MKELDFTKPLRMASRMDDALYKGKSVDFLGTLRNTNVANQADRVAVKYLHDNGVEYSASVHVSFLENVPEYRWRNLYENYSPSIIRWWDTEVQAYEASVVAHAATHGRMIGVERDNGDGTYSLYTPSYYKSRGYPKMK